MMAVRQKILALGFLALAAVPSGAALTYPGCSDMAAGDFAVTTLINNAADTSIKEPTKMALATNDQGNVDVYFVQRYGKVRKYDGTSKTLLTLGNFNFPAGT